MVSSLKMPTFPRVIIGCSLWTGVGETDFVEESKEEAVEEWYIT